MSLRAAILQQKSLDRRNDIKKANIVADASRQNAIVGAGAKNYSAELGLQSDQQGLDVQRIGINSVANTAANRNTTDLKAIDLRREIFENPQDKIHYQNRNIFDQGEKTSQVTDVYSGTNLVGSTNQPEIPFRQGMQDRDARIKEIMGNNKFSDEAKERGITEIDEIMNSVYGSRFNAL